MQQKKALLIAGFVTAVVTTVAVSQGPAVFAAFQPAPVIAEAPAGEVMAEAPAEVVMAQAVDEAAVAAAAQAEFEALIANAEATLVERETALKSRLMEGQASIEELDAHYQPQVADLQANLAATERALGEKTTSLEALQLQLTQASDAAAQDAYLYEQQMRSLQEADALLAQQLNDALAQLEVAYSELAARQVAMAGSSSPDGGNNNANNNNNNNSGGGQQYNDDDHDEGDDEDEHEDHDDDDHGDDHDDDEGDDD